MNNFFLFLSKCTTGYVTFFCKLLVAKNQAINCEKRISKITFCEFLLLNYRLVKVLFTNSGRNTDICFIDKDDAD